MYQLIADGGSTKTDWVLVDEESNELASIRTIGFNPYFHDSSFIEKTLLKEFSELPIDKQEQISINYYGAGCSSESKNAILKTAFSNIFPNSTIEIDHDLIAAARASLGLENGIACILGTGSNSCVWQNGQEIKNIPSHGYLFGDEGSGAYLGIRVLKMYLEGTMQSNIKTHFEVLYHLSKDDIIEAAYQKKSPNVFLAKFARFINSHPHYEPFNDLLTQGFDDFFKFRVLPYGPYVDKKIGCVGSIAFYYKKYFTKVADKYGYEVKNIVRCPIDKLVEFHTNGVKERIT